MLTLPSSVRIFLYTQPTDMRCGFNKLSMFAQAMMGHDPYSGHLFGRKSEKLDPNQRLLFEDLYEEVREKLEKQKETRRGKKVKQRKNINHNGRKPLPEHLRREIIEIEPEASEKTCAVCHNEKQRIGIDHV